MLVSEMVFNALSIKDDIQNRIKQLWWNSDGFSFNSILASLAERDLAMLDPIDCRMMNFYSYIQSCIHMRTLKPLNSELIYGRNNDEIEHHLLHLTFSYPNFAFEKDEKGYILFYRDDIDEKDVRRPMNIRIENSCFGPFYIVPPLGRLNKCHFVFSPSVRTFK